MLETFNCSTTGLVLRCTVGLERSRWRWPDPDHPRCYIVFSTCKPYLARPPPAASFMFYKISTETAILHVWTIRDNGDQFLGEISGPWSDTLISCLFEKQLLDLIRQSPQFLSTFKAIYHRNGSTASLLRISVQCSLLLTRKPFGGHSHRSVYIIKALLLTKPSYFATHNKPEQICFPTVFFIRHSIFLLVIS